MSKFKKFLLGFVCLGFCLNFVACFNNNEEIEASVEDFQLTGKVEIIDPQGDCAKGTLVHLKVPSSSFNEQKYRGADVWLPENYQENVAAGQRYRVLYMFDGEALFNHGLALDVILQDLIDREVIEPLIVVGFYSGVAGDLRYGEYFPKGVYDLLDPYWQDKQNSWHCFPQGRQSDNYLKVLVYKLRPYINQHYAVYTSKDKTSIAGCSLGGLMTMYALSLYPEVFGQGACLSCHWIGGLSAAHGDVIGPKFEQFVRQNFPPASTGTRVYFDHGTIGLWEHLYDLHQEDINACLQAKGYQVGDASGQGYYLDPANPPISDLAYQANFMTLVFPNTNSAYTNGRAGQHCVEEWQRRIAIPLKFLFLKE